MAIGVGVAQLVSFAAIPILTRVFSAQEWGVAGTVFAISAFFSVLFTLRYEVAIVLPKSLGKANLLVFLCLGIALFQCALMLFLAVLFGKSLSNFLANSALENTLFFIPVIALLMSLTSIFTFYCSRLRDFGSISVSVAMQQITYAVVSGLIGYFIGNSSGLLFGKVLSLVIAISLLLRKARKHAASASLMILEVKKVAKKYFRFPLYSLPYSLMVVSSKETIIIVLGLFYDPNIVGAYVLARMVIFALPSVLSSVFGQLIYNEFVESSVDGKPSRNVILLMKVIGYCFAPLYILLAIFAEEIFVVMFGQEWKQAAQFFVILLPAGFLMLFTAWMDRAFEAKEKQKTLFSIQLVFEIVTIPGLLLIALGVGYFFEMVLFYATVQFFYNLVFLIKATKLIGVYQNV